MRTNIHEDTAPICSCSSSIFRYYSKPKGVCVYWPNGRALSRCRKNIFETCLLWSEMSRFPFEDAIHDWVLDIVSARATLGCQQMKRFSLCHRARIANFFVFEGPTTWLAAASRTAAGQNLRCINRTMVTLDCEEIGSKKD